MILEIKFVHWLVILSICISIAGATAYIRDTLRGKTRPNRVSWSMWALAPLIGTAAAIAGGADFWGTSRIFLAGFLPLLVFLATFVNKQSYWKLNTFDVICGCFSLLAVAVWGIVDSTRIAILLAAIGDGVATLPTLFKAWKYPETETGMTYMASLISVILVLPSIPEWNIENASFQVYLLVANMALLFVIYRKRLGFGS